MVGSALAHTLEGRGADVVGAERSALDLRRQADVERWLASARVDGIVIAAGTVGGIRANDTYPADFLYDNLMIAANIIGAAARVGVRKLVMLGSSCMYPRLAPQPVKEEALLTGPLEPTNEWFSIAKIAALKMCQAYRRQHGHDFITVIPTNLYGPGDDFDLETGHVISALIRKIEAGLTRGGPVEIWGTGRPRREFLYVDDAADAIAALMESYSGEAPVNIAGGETVSIAELADLIAEVVGYQAKFFFDESKPDGTPIKQLDNGKIAAMNIWQPRVSLRDGLQSTYRWYRETVASPRGVEAATPTLPSVRSPRHGIGHAR